ncbi:hypothetical protein [Halobacillus kuroshimensis]|uniref:hypothetical protein n=1 Tax=Halobacillus kuroshimensis TaxID=302481 RepID=UPI00040302F4|nr:hypothetical protein [Halobacillus kuroshimensis]
MKTRIGNLILGIIMLVLGAYIGVIEISKSQDQMEFSFLLILSIAIMFFTLAYLHPQMKVKDERIKKIQEKGMFFSYFAIIAYYFLFIMLLGFNYISLTALEAIQILGALTISTVFLIQLILSKVY